MDAKKFNLLFGKIKTHLKAFTKIYNYYFPKIVIHVNVRYKGMNLGDDVAQEFFIKLLKMENIDYIKSPNSWVYTIAENIAKNIIAKEYSYIKVPLEECKIEINDIFEEDLYGEYSEKLKILDEETRQILIWNIWEDYSLKEIAERMGIKYGTVRQKYSRGVKKLKEP